MNKRIHRASDGFVALATVLVIAAVVTSIGLAVSSQSIDAVQSSLFSEQGQDARNMVESCAEDVLLSINKNSSAPSSITLPEGSCSVSINSQSGSTWNFTVVGTLEQHSATLRVEAERTSLVTVTSWVFQ